MVVLDADGIDGAEAILDFAARLGAAAELLRGARIRDRADPDRSG